MQSWEAQTTTSKTLQKLVNKTRHTPSGHRRLDCSGYSTTGNIHTTQITLTKPNLADWKTSFSRVQYKKTGQKRSSSKSQAHTTCH